MTTVVNSLCILGSSTSTYKHGKSISIAPAHQRCLLEDSRRTPSCEQMHELDVNKMPSNQELGILRKDDSLYNRNEECTYNHTQYGYVARWIGSSLTKYRVLLRG